MSGSRRGPVLDWFRLAAAVLMVCNHTAPLSDIAPTADFFLTRVLARVAVPFFFMVSGYFLSQRNWAHTGKFLKKTALVYALAVVLYLPLNWYNGASPPPSSGSRSCCWTARCTTFGTFLRSSWEW